MIYKFLPKCVTRKLWGDREKYGLIPDESDADWQSWQQRYAEEFYPQFQTNGIVGKATNQSYNIVSEIDFRGKEVLEIGPGLIGYLPYLNDKPQKFTLCDIKEEFLIASAQQLADHKIPYEKVQLVIQNKPKLPFPDNSFDIIISFFNLEHLYPLDDYIQEISRVLKGNGMLVGAIPCEGGLAWGLGRLLTTHRYYQRQGIDYNKVICWEHPNFADYIVAQLNAAFNRVCLKSFPFPFLSFDFNIFVKFIYQK